MNRAASGHKRRPAHVVPGQPHVAAFADSLEDRRFGLPIVSAIVLTNVTGASVFLASGTLV